MRYFYLTALAVLLISCGNEKNILSGSGLIETTEVTFSAQAGGQLMALNFDEGENVKVGDTLGVIDTTNVMLKLRQAEAAAEVAQSRSRAAELNIRQASNSLDLANKEFDRASSLIKTGSADQQTYDRAQTGQKQATLAREQAQVSLRAALADYNNASAQLALLQKQVEDCFPVSPANGTIVDKFVEPGELVAAGRPLVKIDRLDTVWVKIYLPPKDLTNITLRGHAFVDPEDGLTKPLDGTITWISSEAEFTPKNVQTREARAGLLYAVKVTIANPNQVLKIGMPVMVTVK